MNNKFGSKDVEFVKKLIEFIKTGVAGTEYKDIELVKLEKGNFKTLRFNAKLESLISDMNLVAVMKKDKDPEVEIKDSESGKPLIKIRFKVEGQSRKSKSGTTYTLYPRNLIEMPSNSLLYQGTK